jgi:endogenous inhibitor of DNA gyrase (YacG/DUF329 family)
MPNLERCPKCAKFVNSTNLDALVERDIKGNFVTYCSYVCLNLDVVRLHSEEPEIIY